MPEYFFRVLGPEGFAVDNVAIEAGSRGDAVAHMQEAYGRREGGGKPFEAIFPSAQEMPLYNFKRQQAGVFGRDDPRNWATTSPGTWSDPATLSGWGSGGYYTPGEPMPGVRGKPVYGRKDPDAPRMGIANLYMDLLGYEPSMQGGTAARQASSDAALTGASIDPNQMYTPFNPMTEFGGSEGVWGGATPAISSITGLPEPFVTPKIGAVQAPFWGSAEPAPTYQEGQLDPAWGAPPTMAVAGREGGTFNLPVAQPQDTQAFEDVGQYGFTPLPPPEREIDNTAEAARNTYIAISEEADKYYAANDNVSGDELTRVRDEMLGGLVINPDGSVSPRPGFEMPVFSEKLLKNKTVTLRDEAGNITGYELDPATARMVDVYQLQLHAFSAQEQRRSDEAIASVEVDIAANNRQINLAIASAANTSAENITQIRSDAEALIAKNNRISQSNVNTMVSRNALAEAGLEKEWQQYIADAAGTSAIAVAEAYASAQVSSDAKDASARITEANTRATEATAHRDEVLKRIDAQNFQMATTMKIDLGRYKADLALQKETNSTQHEAHMESLKIQLQNAQTAFQSAQTAQQQQAAQNEIQLAQVELAEGRRSDEHAQQLDRIGTDLKIAQQHGMTAFDVAQIQFGSANEVAKIQSRYGIDVEEIRARHAGELAATTGWNEQVIANIQSDASRFAATEEKTGVEAMASATEYAAAAGALGQVEASRYGLAPGDYMNLQKSLARGGLDPTERLQLGRIQYTGGLEADPFRQMQETLARGGLTPDQLMQQERIRATGGIMPEDYRQMQLGLARGGLTAEERLAEQRLAAAPQVLSTLTGLLGDPSAVGTLQSLGGGFGGGLGAIMQPFAPGAQAAMPAPTPVGAVPAPFGTAAAPLATTPAPLATAPPPATQQEAATQQMAAGAFATPSLSTLPRIPTLASLGRLSDEEKRRQQGFMAGRGVTPSLLGNLVRSVTPTGPQATSVMA